MSLEAIAERRSWAALRRTLTASRKNTMTISALCIFAGDNPKANPNAAAGYEVFRLPPELNNSEVEGDDFIEIRREGDADDAAIHAMWADARRIVDPFGGDVDCVGPASEEPFNDLFYDDCRKPWIKALVEGASRRF
jgi:hypothetical protein